MELNKQTVYLSVNTDEPSLVVQEYQREVTVDLVKDVEGYFFTPDQLNRYTANVIKQALETAAEKAQTIFIEDECPLTGEEFETRVVDKQSITNTFEETFKRFTV